MSPAMVEKVQRRLVLAVLFAVPVVMFPGGYEGFTAPKFVVLVIGVSAASAWWALFGRVDLTERLRIPLVPAVAVTLPLAVAWIFGPYKAFSLLGDYNRLEGLLPYVVFALLALLVALSPLTKSSVAEALALSGLIVAVYGILQRLGIDFIDWNTPLPGSTIGNSNFAGGFLAIVFPLSLSVALHHLERRGRVVVLLPALIAAGCVLMSSQGGWAALIVGAMLWLGLHLSRHPLAAGVALAAAAVVAAGVVGYVIVSVPDQQSVPNTVELRHLWWTGATDMFLDSPLTGRGPNAFAVESVRYRDPVEALTSPDELADHPHSLVMSFLANAGIVGGLGILVLLLWIGRVVITTDGQDLFAVAVAAALAAYIVQSLVSLDEMSLRVAFWGLVGATALPSVSVPSKRAPKRRLQTRATEAVGPPREPWRWGVAVVCVVPVLWALAYFDSDASLERASGRASAADARRIVETARGVPLVVEFDRINAFYWAAQVEGGREAPTRARLDEAFSYLDTYPEIQGMSLYASALAQLGDHEAAAERYEVVSGWDPYNPLVRADQGLVLLELDRIDRAVGVLEELEPLVGERHPRYWGALALARARAGEEDGARDAAERALFLETDQAEAVEALQLLDGDGGG